MSATLEQSAECEGRSGLHIAGDLTAAAGAQIATGDVVVDGRVLAGAEIRSGGDVRIGGSAQSARIWCAGELHLENGGIVGGHIAAFRGITCKSAGHRVVTPTELAIGIDDAYLDSAELRVSEIDAALRKASDMRRQLDRMVHTQPTLTATQKEQITDLLFRAGEAEKRAAVAIVKLQGRLAEMGAESKLECVISEMLFPGVTFSFPGVQAAVATAVRGPVRIYSVHGPKGVIIQGTNLTINKTFALPSVALLGRRENLLAQLGKLEQSLCR